MQKGREIEVDQNSNEKNIMVVNKQICNLNEIRNIL